MKKVICPECGSDMIEELSEIADYIPSGNRDIPGDYETIGYECRCSECWHQFNVYVN